MGAQRGDRTRGCDGRFVRRAQARHLHDDIAQRVETLLGGRVVTRFKRDGEQYDVIVQVAPLDRTTPADISEIYVRARDGSMVQLANLVDVKEGVAPQSLNHFNRLRAVKVTGTLAPGYTIDEALKALDAAAKVALPKSDMRSSKFMDGVVWDGKDPKKYADSFKVHA